MNWIDEGALYSQIGLFLREDLGRGDITTQSIIARNTRARARFVAGENMIVAGLEAAEEVFLTLDSQQQLEAFVSDGEEVEAGKVIARMVGFADVLISAERVALNLLQRLSGIATLTNQYVKAVEGTGAQITDTRATTPGLASARTIRCRARRWLQQPVWFGRWRGRDVESRFDSRWRCGSGEEREREARLPAQSCGASFK